MLYSCKCQHKQVEKKKKRKEKENSLKTILTNNQSIENYSVKDNSDDDDYSDDGEQAIISCVLITTNSVIVRCWIFFPLLKSAFFFSPIDSVVNSIYRSFCVPLSFLNFIDSIRCHFLPLFLI